MIRFKFLIPILIAFLFSACGSPEHKVMETAATEALLEAPAPAVANGTTSKEELNLSINSSTSGSYAFADSTGSSAQEPPEINSPTKPTTHDTIKNSNLPKSKKIIRNGSMSIKAEEIDSSKRRLDAILLKYDGYYEEEKLTNQDEGISYTLKIRIPCKQFNEFIMAVEAGKDEVVSKNISAQDVTEEFVDLEGRLNSKREYLKRYIEILRKANKVEDMMQVEENIRNLQEEIESAEGRLRFLGDQVSYSTLNIELYDKKPYVYKAEDNHPFWQRLKRSLHTGWSGVVDITIGLLSIWPLMIIAGIVFVVVRRLIRKNAKKEVKA
jgi:hypothetical protein